MSVSDAVGPPADLFERKSVTYSSRESLSLTLGVICGVWNIAPTEHPLVPSLLPAVATLCLALLTTGCAESPRSAADVAASRPGPACDWQTRPLVPGEKVGDYAVEDIVSVLAGDYVGMTTWAHEAGHSQIFFSVLASHDAITVDESDSCLSRYRVSYILESGRPAVAHAVKGALLDAQLSSRGVLPLPPDIVPLGTYPELQEFPDWKLLRAELSMRWMPSRERSVATAKIRGFFATPGAPVDQQWPLDLAVVSVYPASELREQASQGGI